MNYKEFYGTTEIANYLGVSRMSVNRLIRGNIIRSIDIEGERKGKTYLIPHSALLDYISTLK